ncbi:MAG: FAD binding domain-containing protein [Chloroflexota bacterium]
MWTTYHTVSTVDEAVQHLNTYRERARIIAGGTDLLIELEHGKRPDVDTIIDITRVPHLDTIELHDDNIHLGCLVNHNHVVASDVIRQYALPLAQASWEVGAPQIRNRATIAGNLITASSANDTITPLIALNAQVVLKSVDGERTVPLSEFYTGLRQTVMQTNEMLTQIIIPAMKSSMRGIFIKLGLRRAQAISVVNCAVILDKNDDATLTDAHITLGSVAPTIIRVPNAEKSLIGKRLNADTIRDAAHQASATPTPIDDVRSTAEYRSEMVKVLVARALRQLALDEQLSNLPQNPAMLWGTHQAQVNGNAVDSAYEHDNTRAIHATINGESHIINTGQTKTLLNWLREDVALTGTKVGCSEGECGACTVFLDDVAVMSCMVPAPRAHNAEIVTVEGLTDREALHPIQDTFIETGAVQCGYCTPGFIMSGAKLLTEHPNPTTEQIQQSISGNLCRCTGYYKIVEAFQQASTQQSSEE